MRLYDERSGVYGRVKEVSVRGGRLALRLAGGREVEVEAASLRRVPQLSGGLAALFWMAVLAVVVYCAALLVRGVFASGARGGLAFLAYCAVAGFAGWRLKRAVEAAMGLVFAGGSVRLVCESRDEVRELLERISASGGAGEKEEKKEEVRS